MAKGSELEATIIGLFGMGVFAISGLFFLISLLMLIFSTVILSLVFQLPLISAVEPLAGPIFQSLQQISVVGLIVSAIIGYLGFKWMVNNQTEVTRFFMGVLGVLIMAVGLIVFYLTGWSGLGALIGGSTALVGLMFLQVGFRMQFIAPLNGVYSTLARLP